MEEEEDEGWDEEGGSSIESEVAAEGAESWADDEPSAGVARAYE